MLSLAASLAWVSLPTASAETDSNETIIVHGITPKAIRGEVDKMVAAPWYQQLARWGNTFCPTVEGLPEPYREVVVDHLQKAARAMIPDLSTSCAQSNVFVLFTDDGTEAFNRILAQAPLLGKTVDPLSAGDSSSSPSKGEIAELRQDRPVRWFRKTVNETAPGVILRLWAWAPHRPAFDRTMVSPMDKDTQARVNSLTVIVDAKRASGAKLGQLSDYIAFVALGDPELGVSFSPISIMSLYNNDTFNAAAPSSMTRFDGWLLHALFEANPARDAHVEQAEISALVHERLANQNTASP
ncbi:MAG: hypothetical protein ACRYGI_09145 [Janthinobacterium lividum]